MGKVHPAQGLAHQDRKLYSLEQIRQRVTIHSRRQRQPHHERKEGEPLNSVLDSGTFITTSYGMGYPPKIFTYVDSDSDTDIPLHIPNLEEYCRT